jgi:hypothetical protein
VLSVHLFIAVLLLATFVPSVARSQDDLSQAKLEAEGFFSGNVVEVAADRVVVSRTLLGKASEKRTFKITQATKVEGKIKQKSRVTVRYTPGGEGDVALSILVRERAEKNDSKKK